MHFKQVKVGLKLPIPGLGDSGFSVEGTWEASEQEVAIAWSVYVELATRIGVAGLPPGTGNLREALTSYHALFLHVRQALHNAGPAITRRQPQIDASMAEILLALLNRTLRPMLSLWHPLLMRHEEAIPEGKGTQEHEDAWDHAKELEAAMANLHPQLLSYARFLEAICDIKHSPLGNL